MSNQSVGRGKFFPTVDLFFYAVILLCLPFHCNASETVVLSWGANNNPLVTGFHIHYGTVSHSYSNIVTVGNTNQVNVTGLTFGTNYYFAVSEVDSRGDESALSSEVSFQAGSAMLTSAYVNAHLMSVGLQGSPGQSYIIQYSTNYLNWTSYCTNTAPFQFTIPINQAITHFVLRACRYK